MNKHVIVATDATFQKEVLESSMPVLVDFWAPWCGPCRIVGPVIEELAEEYAGKVMVVKFNTDENEKVPAVYGIMSIPTLAVFNNGEVIDGVVGAVPKKGLSALLQKQLKQLSTN